MREIVGREEELAAVGSFLEAAAFPRALVVLGEPGIGKTTLLRAGVDGARERGFRVLAAAPAAAEASTSFAALADLLGAVAGEALPALAPPRRRALAVALRLEEASRRAPDRLAVSLAFVDTLATLARPGPLLVAVDDAQWLDPASARVLEYAACRVDRHGVAFLVAARVGGGVPLALDRALPDEVAYVALGPLTLGALHVLLHERLGSVFSRPVLRRLHELSAGNPFFALELARGVADGKVALQPGAPLPPDLAGLVSARIRELPPRTRGALAALAAVARPTLSVVSPRALEPAVAAGLVEIAGDDVRFTHPLLASAAYSLVPPADRRRLHRALARALDDPEERARHLALAADAPSAHIAAELEAAAGLAQARGAAASAAELAERAIRLTPPGDAEAARRRAAAAAGYSFEAGDAARARLLLEEALAGAPPGRERAQLVVDLGRVRGFGDDLRAAAGLYIEAVREPHASDETRIEAEAGLATALMRLLDDLPRAEGHARKAVALAGRRGEPRRLAEHLGRQAMIAALLGRRSALALARRAAELERTAAASGEPESVVFLRGLDAGLMLGVVLAFVERFVEARVQFDAARRRAEELGDESSLPLLFRYSAYAAWLAGDWSSAARDAAEGYAAALQTGQVPQRGVLAGTNALIAAHLGRAAEAREAAEEAFRIGEETGAGSGFGTLLASWALGALELSRGDAAAVHERLGPQLERLEAAGVREPGVVRLVADEVEALVRLGRLDEAGALVERTEERARRLGRSGVLALCSRCRGIVRAAHGDLEGSARWLERALDEHDVVEIPFERARTLLSLGRVYRRAKRRGAAREALGGALAAFEALGAETWAESTRAELARIGGRPRVNGLTPTERRVAGLVVEGLTNKEVAAALFVAPKTVDVTLSRIYAKLGIHSRVELARRLSKL